MAKKSLKNITRTERSIHFARREAAKVLRCVLKGDSERRAVGSIKSLVYKPNVRNKKATFALVCETLKHLAILKKVLAATNILRCKWKRQAELIYLITYDILFGQGVVSTGDAESFVLSHKELLQSSLARLVKENGSSSLNLLPIDNQNNGLSKPRYVRVNTLKVDVHSALQILQKTAEISETFFRSSLASMEKTYLSKNPTVSSVLDFVRTYDGGQVCYDHFAFRTFNVDNCGISALAQFFLDFGYTARGELNFPAKHLRALWFSPPQHLLDCNGEGINGPLPRIFISELLVDKLSPEAQEIIKKYTSISSSGSKYAALASVLGSLTWPTPLLSDYQLLARESEYAAWTLVNGYALNHLTISVHRLKSDVQKIGKLNELIQSNKFKLNTQGGILKVSPDGRLLQSSTVADSMVFYFAEGISESVPASYIEFAERLVLPEYESFPVDKISELHRRDGFEVGNADKIFESTSAEQLRRKVA